MGKDKLRKFAENLTFDNLIQPEFDDIFRRDHRLKGRWGVDFFGRSNSEGNLDDGSLCNSAGNSNNNPVGNPSSNSEIAVRPIVLELGCGKGEYTVGLGAAHHDKNFIGIDIKGARMWRGAKTATETVMRNVGFLRTRIEFINSFFAPGEISEIWITFPDPQLKKGREKKRLTSPVFLDYYARFLAPGGIIHLKTDSRELHDYTLDVIRELELPLHVACADIYGTGTVEKIPVLNIKTAYERHFLAEGKPITYLSMSLK